MGDCDADILIWSEHQGDVLRRLSTGERVSDRVDWANVSDEVADAGRNTLRACRTHLLQASLRDLTAEAWPLSRDVPHWRSEARVARIKAPHAFAPSMRQKINVADLYVKALHATPVQWMAWNQRCYRNSVPSHPTSCSRILSTSMR